MKRFLSLTLVAIMLLSTLALTSCDPVNDVKSFVNKVLGKDEPAEEVRTTISELEWRKVYLSKNYTLDVDSSGEYVSIVAADNVVDLHYMGLDLIIDLKSGYLISESSGIYTGANMGENMFVGADFSLGAMGFMPEIEYANLVYDEALKCYTVEDDYLIGEFHFKNGQLEYALMIPAREYVEGKIEIRNVGTTTLEVPEYIDLTDGKLEPNKAGSDVVTTVTEEQLTAAFDVPNLTLTANIIVGEMVIKMDETSMSGVLEYMGGLASEVYLTRIDGVIHTLEYDSTRGVYVATPADEDDNILGPIGNGEMDFTFDDLTYNQEGRYYEFERDGVKYYFYFANGQLTGITMMGDAMGMGIDMEIICNVSDVGTTTVSVPDYVIQTPTVE